MASATETKEAVITPLIRCMPEERLEQPFRRVTKSSASESFAPTSNASRLRARYSQLCIERVGTPCGPGMPPQADRFWRASLSLEQNCTRLRFGKAQTCFFTPFSACARLRHVRSQHSFGALVCQHISICRWRLIGFWQCETSCVKSRVENQRNHRRCKSAVDFSYMLAGWRDPYTTRERGLAISLDN